MQWRSYSFFLKFLSVIVGGSIAVLGLAVLIGEPLNPKAQMLRGDPFYDAIRDLVSIFGRAGTGIGLVVAGLVIGVILYRSASR